MTETAPPRMTAEEFGTITNENTGSIVRWAVCKGPLGGYNGYVKLSEGHPWSNHDDYEYDDCLKDAQNYAPGGITFARGLWIGFDTAHAWDYWPGEDQHPTMQMANEMAKGYGYDPQFALEQMNARLWTKEELIAEAVRLAAVAVMAV